MLRTCTGQPCNHGAPATPCNSRCRISSDRRVQRHRAHLNNPQALGEFSTCARTHHKDLEFGWSLGRCVSWSPKQRCDSGIWFHTAPMLRAARWPGSTGTFRGNGRSHPLTIDQSNCLFSALHTVICRKINLETSHEMSFNIFFLRTCFRRAFHPEAIATEYTEMGPWAGGKVTEKKSKCQVHISFLSFSPLYENWILAPK